MFGTDRWIMSIPVIGYQFYTISRRFARSCLYQMLKYKRTTHLMTLVHSQKWIWYSVHCSHPMSRRSSDLSPLGLSAIVYSLNFLIQNTWFCVGLLNSVKIYFTYGYSNCTSTPISEGVWTILAGFVQIPYALDWSSVCYPRSHNNLPSDYKNAHAHRFWWTCYLARNIPP